MDYMYDEYFINQQESGVKFDYGTMLNQITTTGPGVISLLKSGKSYSCQEFNYWLINTTKVEMTASIVSAKKVDCQLTNKLVIVWFL